MMCFKSLVLSCLLFLASGLQAKEVVTIPIVTKNISLIFKVSPKDGRLYQSYFGKKLSFESDIAQLPLGKEAYLAHGMEDYFEPAIRVLHHDGNPSLLLKYVSHTSGEVLPGVEETVIVLRDEEYPVEVELHFLAYRDENVLKEYAVVVHHEKKPLVLYQCASSLLHFNRNRYFLTEFSGDWAREANMHENPLDFGKKVIDTKLGSRANMFVSPFFLLALDERANENEGDVLVGTLGWTGNFRFTFEIDNGNQLRVLSGINPYASEYALKPGEKFRTPEFIFTYSTEGTGKASRDIHRWARKYQLKDGEKTRMTLLNNWESTYFNFNEDKLVGLLDEAVDLGVDMFLLDDGWFGNKYPRNSDRQGLGDWEETITKLPHGVGYLAKEAEARGLCFGLWIEPEMVNPKSELYEKHKDWVIHLPNRKEYYYRNQLVLDLSNPDVQDFVYGVVDGLLMKYPGIAYFKWDCNSPITNIYSPYLKDKQSHLYIDYVRGFYNVLQRIQAKYPDLPMMLCSGGGGRCDYEALKYFTEFWPSDNTDALERLYIQWGYSYVFPSKSLAAHVTSWGKQPLKFRTDVASMGRLGFDIRVEGMSEQEVQFCRAAVKNFKRLEQVILDGNLYRLSSPYESQHTASMYVEEGAGKALLFAFDLYPRYGKPVALLRLQGLEKEAIYRLEEINLMPGAKSSLPCQGKIYSGEYLMQVGILVFSARSLVSHVIEITQIP